MKTYKNIPFGRFNMPEKCYICKGTGLDICPRCFGHDEDCRECGGRGVVKCYACGGRGVV